MHSNRGCDKFGVVLERLQNQVHFVFFEFINEDHVKNYLVFRFKIVFS